MTTSELAALAELLRERDAVNERIAAIIGLPTGAAGQVGNWIAAQVFDIRLADNAVNPAYDGWFASGPLADRTVTIKWYARQESLLDMSIAPAPDDHLVLTGPRSDAAPAVRPWVIAAAHLFSSADLLAEREVQGIRMGVATRVPQAMWQAAEIYPRAANRRLRLTQEQVRQLQLFAPTA